MKCSACITAKACIRSPASVHSGEDLSDRRLQRFVRRVNSTKEKKLKEGHLKRGDCISADHYISAVHGRLPHTFGCESKGYTCGTLFVDHASGKVFNYCQFSTNAYETIQSKHRLEALARQEGVDIKVYHSDNGQWHLCVC